MSEHAQAGRSWEDMAENAYGAYAANTGNKNYQGLPMPTWKDLPPAIRTAWEAAARHVGNMLHYPGADNSPQEWAGWVPPK